PYRAVVAHELPRLQQQVEEIEAARARLQVLVCIDDGPELVAQARREFGSRPIDERLQRRLERIPALEELRLREAVGRAPEAGPSPVLRARELDELGLETVVVARPDRLPPPDLVGEARDLRQGLHEPVVRVSRGGEAAERGHLVDESVDRPVAIEALLVAPWGGEGPPLDELPRRVPEALPRAPAPRCAGG